MTRRGGERVSVHVHMSDGSQLSPALVRLVDRGDGTVAVSYVPTTPGTCTVHVAVNAQPLERSPFTVTAIQPHPLRVRAPQSLPAAVVLPSGEVTPQVPTLLTTPPLATLAPEQLGMMCASNYMCF